MFFEMAWHVISNMTKVSVRLFGSKSFWGKGIFSKFQCCIAFVVRPGFWEMCQKKSFSSTVLIYTSTPTSDLTVLCTCMGSIPRGSLEGRGTNRSLKTDVSSRTGAPVGTSIVLPVQIHFKAALAVVAISKSWSRCAHCTKPQSHEHF